MAIVVAELSRGTRLERVRRGDVVVVDAGGKVLATGGEPRAGWFGTEVLAPFLAVPLVASGASAALGFTVEEIAATCSTTRPTPIHRAIASSMLGKVRAGLERDRPSLVGSLDTLLGSAGECTAHFAGTIAACCHAGIDPAGLLSPDHPERGCCRAILASAFSACGTDVALDDRCRSGMRVRAAPRALASAYAIVADPKGAWWDGEPAWRAALVEIRAAMLAHPELVAGADAPDTAVICATDGEVLARMDRSGSLCLAIPGHGVGIALRDEGASPGRLASAGVDVLEELGFVDAITVERLRRWLRLVPGEPARVIGGESAAQAVRQRTAS